jgi:predicted dehydrogenase
VADAGLRRPPLRVLLAGAGAQGRQWLTAMQRSANVAVAGIVDLDRDTAYAAAAGLDIPVDTRLSRLALRSPADAVVNATAPAAHVAVTLEALALGLPVLSEKPVADTMAGALTLAAATETGNLLLMVNQSRRYNARLHRLRSVVRQLGDVIYLTSSFFRPPYLEGFRASMEHPLLRDMAIHAFDAARFILTAEPVAVHCDAFNPAGSPYSGKAAASAVFEMSTGTRFAYTGSWCSTGFTTSWNCEWRASGRAGTVCWDGESEPGLDVDAMIPSQPSADGPSAEYLAGALDDFRLALSTGRKPMGEVHDNIWSHAMVEAAIRSAETGSRVALHDVLDAAYEQALDLAPKEVAEVLRMWSSPRVQLGTS